MGMRGIGPSESEASAMTTLEQWPIDRPVPWERNARVVSDAAVRKVAASIRAFGFRNPVLVDEHDNVIAGHTRLLAARKLHLQTVPVIVCEGLSPEEVRGLRLADNRTAQETTWEFGRLNDELADLASLGFDLALTGFDPDELAGLGRGDASESDDGDGMVQCPECGARFRPGG